MIKTIIFDYGNVIFEPVTEAAIKNMIKKYNISEKTALGLFATKARQEGYKFRTGKITARQYWKAVSKKLGITNKETMTIRDQLLESYIPKPGMIELLNTLNKNYNMIVFSGNTRERVMHVNRKYRVNRFFSEFIFSFANGYNKNDMRFYKILQKRIKNPDQSIVIDDHPYVLRHVKEHGFNNTILFKSPEQLKRELKKYQVKF